MSESDRVLVEILVAAPIEEVWRALRDPAEIRRWFGWEYASLTEEIDFIFVNGFKADAATHTLSADGIADRYTLEAAGPGQTVVRVIRSAPVTDVSWKGIYDDMVEGWLTFTQQLRFALERHPGADRRTIYLNGRAAKAGTPLPVQALGLDSLVVVPLGQRYSVTAAHGERLGGEIWFRAPYQLGLTVDAYGDGLVIIGTRPVTDKSSHGGGSVVVSTYGLSDPAFRSVSDQWTRWWLATYDTIDIYPPCSAGDAAPIG